MIKSGNGTSCQEMLIAVIAILVGLLLLYYGAEWLVEGSSSLALGVGLSPLVVGLTVVAYGTSAPELAVSVDAAFTDKGDIAIGNVIGSNIANIGIVLGVAALIRPMRVNLQMVQIHAPLMVASAALLTWFLRDGRLNRPEGAMLFLAVIAYTALSLKLGRQEARKVRKEVSELPVDKPGSVWKAAGLTLFGLLVLMGGGHVLVVGAVKLAHLMQVSEAVIGLTIVAVGTSLPDLMASAVAAYRGQGDLAIGNAIGSVMFNLLNVTGVAAMLHPIDASDVNLADCFIMIAILALTLPLLRTGLVLKRWEGGLMVACYAGYVSFRWFI